MEQDSFTVSSHGENCRHAYFSQPTLSYICFPPSDKVKKFIISKFKIKKFIRNKVSTLQNLYVTFVIRHKIIRNKYYSYLSL
jgi:hypothetical protein